MCAALNDRIENSTDATRGQPLAERVVARKSELEEALALTDERDVLLRSSLQTALDTATALMTGDVKNPSEVVARDLNLWLERNKHLGI